MAGIPLTYAGYDYWDRSRPLIDGRVRPDNIDLTYIVMPPVQSMFSPQLQAIEASLSSYMVMRAQGDDRLIGVPVFLARRFVHGYIFVRSDAGIERPEDLVGKRVGIPHYQSTPVVWMRAFLQHDYGIAPSSIHWFEGGVDVPARGSNRPPVDMPSEIQIATIGDDETLSGMLLAGELDALMTAQRSAPFLSRHPRIRRLFLDYQEREREYFRRTGLLPNMHVVLLRHEVYEQHPWIPQALLTAFEAAKAATRERLQETGNVVVALPWLAAHLEETEQLFGPDPFPYGLKANIPTLEALSQYLVEQGLAQRRVEPKELFAVETLDM